MLLGTGGGMVEGAAAAGRRAVLAHQFRHALDRGVRRRICARLAEAFDPARMDALLLLAPTAGSIGYAGRGDFRMAPDGRLTARGERDVGALRLCRRGDPFAQRCSQDAPAGEFSLTALFDARRRKPAACTACALEGHVDACRHAGRHCTGGTSDRGGR